jgi:hypothetical protein
MKHNGALPCSQVCLWTSSSARSIHYKPSTFHFSYIPFNIITLLCLVFFLYFSYVFPMRAKCHAHLTFLLLFKSKTNSEAFNSQANYTGWVTAAGLQNLVPNFADRGVSRRQLDWCPVAADLGFLDQSCQFTSKYFSFILTRLSGPSSRPTVSQKIWRLR